jgi:hypothetical protein
MSLNSQIQQVLKAHVEFIVGSEQEMSVLASTALIGLASKRIFNNVSGSKNAEDESLGTYTDDYKIAKSKRFKGRNELYVNLYATGTLYGSLKQVKDNKNDTYVAVTDIKYPKGQSTVEVSDYLDKQYGEIFAPTSKEAKVVTETVDRFIIKKSKEFFSQ